MKSWFAPLWIFIGGNLILLVFFLFMPGVDTSVATLSASVNATVKSTFWGFSWVTTSGVVRWLLYAGAELFILFGTGMALLKSKT